LGVAGGADQPFVYFPQVANALPGEVVAQDEERGIALLRVKFPRGLTPKVLPLVSNHALSPGDRVAAFGYAIGKTLADGLKLTTAVVGSPPDGGNDHMLVLQARVNSGNDGGPVYDAFGGVIGMMVTKKISDDVNGAAMAIPSSELVAFLQKHIKTYKPSSAESRQKAWEDIDRSASGSVLGIILRK
jgi:S1-C subfamily serine protease